MGDLTAPPWIGHTNTEELAIFVIICVAILLAISLLIWLPTYFLSRKNKNQQQLLNSLEQKKAPVIFSDNINNNIIIVALNKYSEIEIQFTLFNQKNDIVKQYTIKEFNFNQNEQRIIANLNDFDAYKIDYKIINFN